MRKVLVAALALVALAAVASVAIAANTYTLHKASTSAKGKGSKAKPIPTNLVFGFQVGETDSSKRATVIEKYTIGGEGLVANTKVKPKCAFTELDDPSGVPAKCNKALVGKGLVKNAAGSSSGPVTVGEQLALQPAAAALQHRQGHGDQARQQRQAARRRTSSRTRSAACCRSPRRSMPGSRSAKIGGVTTSDLRFTVPQNLKHPLTGVDNSIRESVSTIALAKKKINGKTGRLLQQGRMQGQQADHPRQLHDRGNGVLAAPDVHGQQAGQVLATA